VTDRPSEPCEPDDDALGDDDDDLDPDSVLHPGARELAVHGALFAAACGTTYWFGGIAFSATLMSILAVHELGHYLAARHHRVDASLPYFIPMPPQVSLGTLGAIIRMRRPISDRNKLLDVGAAGPLAGLALAIPLLLIGLYHSPLIPVQPGKPLEGNSLLYGLCKLIVFGRWLPGGGVDVDLQPMAFAAWVGLLVTMINLIPIGQLDGGHVARAWLGDRHEEMSRRLHVALPLVAAGVALFLVVEARLAGADWLHTARYAGFGALPWLIWAAVLVWMRRMGDGVYHPPVGSVPLTAGRRRLAVFVLIVWILIFTPIPMRPPLI
jgi:membrane-associated protease RseP (regulator of RpoE activity)